MKRRRNAGSGPQGLPDTTADPHHDARMRLASTIIIEPSYGRPYPDQTLQHIVEACRLFLPDFAEVASLGTAIVARIDDTSGYVASFYARGICKRLEMMHPGYCFSVSVLTTDDRERRKVTKIQSPQLLYSAWISRRRSAGSPITAMTRRTSK